MSSIVSPWVRRLAALLRERRLRAQRWRRAQQALDRLFLGNPQVLAQGRLKPHHRGRVTLLEIDESEVDGAPTPTRLLLGIVRHPKAHPLAPRGDEVLELLEYRPLEATLRNVGSHNLTRSRGG